MLLNAFTLHFSRSGAPNTPNTLIIHHFLFIRSLLLGRAKTAKFHSGHIVADFHLCATLCRESSKPLFWHTRMGNLQIPFSLLFGAPDEQTDRGQNPQLLPHSRASGMKPVTWCFWVCWRPPPLDPLGLAPPNPNPSSAPTIIYRTFP